MSTMPPDELLKLWTLEKMPLEMTMGHVLQNLVKVQASLDALETSSHKLQSNVDGLLAHTGIKVPAKRRPKKS
jgi:hypothetical protein